VDEEIGGYKLWWGGAERAYTNCVDVGTNLLATISFGYTSARPVHFAVTAYAINGIESDFSEEVQFPPRQVKWVKLGVTILNSASVNGPWQEVTNATLLQLEEPKGALFWRARPTIKQEYR
jgi:hypothetical protein